MRGPRGVEGSDFPKMDLSDAFHVNLYYLGGYLIFGLFLFFPFDSFPFCLSAFLLIPTKCT